jgi:osmotically-inducible protein OsmY
MTNKFLEIKLQEPVANWQVKSTIDAPRWMLPIVVGQQVILSDGHPGWITHLLPDRDGRLEAFAIQTRGWWRRKVVIPMEYIDHVDEETVYLSLTKPDLKKLSTYRPDHVVAAAVYQALWEDTIFRRTEYRQIRVEAENGIAYLSGYVSSPTMSEGAEKAAFKADGVWKVVNRLEIDSDIRLAVSQAIGKDPLTKHARVYVGVHNGFVTLNGFAPGLAGRAAAQEQAVTIPSVRGVFNSISVPGVEVGIEEPRTLQPTIGADIYASDIKIGKVEKVIINPQNRLVAAILAKAILPNANRLRENEIYSESQVIIPIETVRHANSTSIFLNVKAAVLAKFNEYDPSVYFTASQDWEAPYPYNCQDVLLPRPTGA